MKQWIDEYKSFFQFSLKDMFLDTMVRKLPCGNKYYDDNPIGYIGCVLEISWTTARFS